MSIDLVYYMIMVIICLYGVLLRAITKGQKMRELANGCKNPILLEWTNKVWKYDQVHTSMMMNDYFESLLDYTLDSIDLYGFDIEEHLYDSEHFMFEFQYDKYNDMTAYLMTNSDYAVLVFRPTDSEIYDVFGEELFGIIKISELWAYMDSLPNLKKRILPLNRKYHDE